MTITVIAMVAVVMGMSTLPMFLPTAEAVETTTIIPYLDTNYKFKVVTSGTLTGFESPTFDDSGFSTGDAGFGTPTGICALNNSNDVKTSWALNTDILLRKNFNLPAGAFNLKISVAIDNDIQVFINGVDVSGGLNVHEGCSTRDSFVFTAPDNILNKGGNLLAVRAQDRGVLSYVDVEVEFDIIDVTIDIKPGSDPSSVSCKNLKGNVPVAIFGSDTFDVINIEIVSMNLVGLDPIQVFEVHDELHIEDLNDDGFDDAVVHLDKAGVCEATSTATLKETVEVEVTGKTTDGTPFVGIGDIRIVKR